jgi:hypothetical protein
MRVKFRIAAHATPPGTGGQQTQYQDQKTWLLDKRRANFAATLCHSSEVQKPNMLLTME